MKELNNQIKDLKKKTCSEETLAVNINKKLKYYVKFELIYYCPENINGYYQVKDLKTNNIRNITELSQGEKNIIAFLYFLEQLDDINKETDKQKIIIFDDPMTSNDDTMQYIMIIELQTMCRKIERSNVLDKVIILTHNSHFYVNVSWKLKKKYEKYNFYKFISTGMHTKVKKISKEEEDLKTSYSGLWYDLRYLYNDENCRPEILHNIIRRIIETYCKFNLIDENIFYEDVMEIKKFLNVNSHAIDNLEVDLNGRSKQEILQNMKAIFDKNNAEEHFNAYWDDGKNI